MPACFTWCRGQPEQPCAAFPWPSALEHTWWRKGQPASGPRRPPGTCQTPATWGQGNENSTYVPNPIKVYTASMDAMPKFKAIKKG